jgi:stearoyl-CoA desaturase (Delta-9 desaturase)
LLGGRLRDGLTGLLWGGTVRMLVLHHVTYSINSLCHFFGHQRFHTPATSRATSRG